MIIEDTKIKKRNRLFTEILALSIVLAATFFVVYQEQQDSANANQAIIYHSLSGTPSFSNDSGTENYIIIYCANTGETTGDFNLTVEFVNATFSAATQQPYTQINTASAEFRWNLKAGDSASKNVYFSIDHNVNGFSISLSIHSNQASLKTIAEPPNFLQYKWEGNAFKLSQ